MTQHKTSSSTPRSSSRLALPLAISSGSRERSTSHPPTWTSLVSCIVFWPCSSLPPLFLPSLQHNPTTHLTPPPLVCGPTRAPSQRAQAQLRAESEMARRAAARSTTNPHASSSSAYPAYPSASSTSPTQQEGWGAWASRTLNERTEKLAQVGDSMESLQANSAGWADDVGKFVQRQKRGLVTGLVKSKFGL